MVLLSRKPSSYEDAVQQINSAGGKAIGISTDSTDEKSLAAAFETIKKELPGYKLAAAVYNVRPSTMNIFGPFLERTLEQLDHALHVEV